MVLEDHGPVRARLVDLVAIEHHTATRCLVQAGDLLLAVAQGDEVEEGGEGLRPGEG